MASLELGPFIGELEPWHEQLWHDDWIVALSHANDRAILIYISTPGEDPLAVYFERVKEFRTDRQKLNPGNLPAWIVGSQIQKTGGINWLTVTDSQENFMFEIAYATAQA